MISHSIAERAVEATLAAAKADKEMCSIDSIREIRWSLIIYSDKPGFVHAFFEGTVTTRTKITLSRAMSWTGQKP
jgi:hypothetical protein